MKKTILSLALFIISSVAYGLVDEGPAIKVIIGRNKEKQIRYKIVPYKLIVDSPEALAKKCYAISNKTKYANLVDIDDKAGLDPKEIYLLCETLMKSLVYPGEIVSIQNGKKVRFTLSELLKKYKEKKISNQ